MKQIKKYLAPDIIILLVLFFIGGYSLKEYMGLSLDGKRISQNILYLGPAITALSGTVEKINADTVTVKMDIPESSSIPPAPTSLKLAKKDISLNFKLTEATGITGGHLSVPYLLNNNTSKKQTIADIPLGAKVTVYTNTDIRTMENKTIEAREIYIYPIANKVDGKIVSISGTLLKIMPMHPLINGGTSPYEVQVTKDTEISTLDSKTLKPVKFATTDLKKDMIITVYASADITKNKNITALRIDTSTTPPYSP